MTQHLDHGSIPAFVEQNPARHEQRIREAEARRLLADPIAFAQNMARVIEHGMLSDLLMPDAPKQVEDLQDKLADLVDLAIERKDLAATEDAFQAYRDFVIFALGEAREYGVAFGAIMEQLRGGLTAVVDLRHRGLTQGDVNTMNDLARVRRKHDLRTWGAETAPAEPSSQAPAA